MRFSTVKIHNPFTDRDTFIHRVDRFEIHADHRGVLLKGESPWLENMEDLQTFAEELSLAYRNYERLKIRIDTDISGFTS